MSREGLKNAIRRTINEYSAENGCDTPDFILAEYLLRSLDSFDLAVNQREQWYGREKRKPGTVIRPAMSGE